MILRAAGVAVLALELVLAPSIAGTQPASKVARVGVLSSSGPEQEVTLLSDLRERLRERGWVDGQNLTLDVRYAGGDYQRVPALVAEALRLQPDVLMTRGGPMTAGAKRATTTTPIVMWNVTDPVGIGVAASLARPGGNVTGFSDAQDAATVGKRLQLLKEVAPRISRVAIVTRVPPLVMSYVHAYDDAARMLGLQLHWSHLSGPDDVAKALGEITRAGFEALDVNYAPVTWLNRHRIQEFATRNRLPAVYWHRGYVLDGGLMAYGEDEREVPKRLAEYIDKILRGARPADLPVEQPTKFELVINLRTARALGLSVPQSMRLRADHVIE